MYVRRAYACVFVGVGGDCPVCGGVCTHMITFLRLPLCVCVVTYIFACECVCVCVCVWVGGSSLGVWCVC